MQPTAGSPPPSSSPIANAYLSVFEEEQYKGWKRCLWVKCIQGIGSSSYSSSSSTSSAKGGPKAKKKSKSVFDGACPDLKEDHLKVALLKSSPHYEAIFGACCVFGELQRYSQLNI